MKAIIAAVAAAGFALGFLASDWRDQGTIERLRGDLARMEAALAKAAEEQLADGIARAATVFRADRRLVARLLRERDQAREEAAETERRLAHALARDALDDCAADESWRVLVAQYRRLAREHARAATRAGGVDEGPGPAARAAGDGGALTCADAFRYATALLDGWDALATRLRALQAAVRAREEARAP